jgi:hypothetical protein
MVISGMIVFPFVLAAFCLHFCGTSDGHQLHGIELVPIASYTLIDKGLKTLQVFRS